MLVIFQYINYQYLILFSNNYIIGTTTDVSNASVGTHYQQLNRVIASIRTYVNWNFFALFFSGALMFQFFLKIIFNICAKKRIAFDKWTIMDTLSAVLNIAAV